MIRTAAIIAALSGPAYADPSCDEMSPILAAYAANAKTVTAMASWCVKTDPTQRACRELLKSMKANDTDAANSSASDAMPLIMMKCREN